MDKDKVYPRSKHSWKQDILNSAFFSEKMLWCCVLAIAVCSCSDLLYSLWIDWFGTWIDRFYSIVVSHTALLWILVFSVIWLGCRSLWRVWRADSLSPPLLPLGFSALWLIVNWPGPYIRIYGDLTFRQLLAAWFILAFLVGLARRCYDLWRSRRSKAQNADTPKGLIVGHPAYYEDGRKKFASALASLVRNTDLRERGATIGITGEWGAGKTLVLREIKSVLEKDMTVIEFYPWQSSSPDNLIEDLFQTFASRLHPHSRTLSLNLKNYADKLIALDIDKHINFMAKIGRWAGGGDRSINDARREIQRKLDRLSKSIVVIIDDLDRLDKDELFETLRLVRNTAHFRNIAYIIAYDPDYTVKMLERKGIENAKEYLHKIFMLSLSLPSYENFTYVEVIRQIIKRHFEAGSDDYARLDPLVSMQNENCTGYFLSDFVHNYRQAVQFGHFIIANYLVIKEMSPDVTSNFDLNDWYRLQVLRFFYPDACNRLQQTPESFFGHQYFRFGLYRFDQDTFNNSGIKLPPGALPLIKAIFSKLPSQASPTGIVQMRNFFNYFACRILSTEISESEFVDMLNDVRPKSLVLTEWKNRRPNVWKSVDSHFATHTIGSLTDAQISIYVGALLWWNALVESHRSIVCIREITEHTATTEQIAVAAKAYYETVLSMISNPGIRADIIARIIVSQAPEPEDPTVSADEQESPVPLVKPSQTRELFEKLIEREFEHNRIKSADDISVPESSLFRIMSSAYTATDISAQDYTIFRNYALEPVREFFDRHLKANPGLMKGSNLGRLKAAFGYKPTGDQKADADSAERSDRLIRSFFECDENMRQIIFGWFKGSKEEKKRIISALNIE